MFILVLCTIIFTNISCRTPDDLDNPVLGKWNSLWSRSPNKSINFNIRYESNNSFFVEAFAGEQTQPQRISGNYKINRDTLIIWDVLEEPLQLCSYTDSGKYTFKRSNDTLFFKVIIDRCERRKLTLEMGLVKSK